MRKLVDRICFFVVPMAMVFSAAVSALGQGMSTVPVVSPSGGPVQFGQSGPDAPPPHPKGSNPKPEDAVRAILAAFDKYEVVGMAAAHGSKDIDDFVLGLIRNPAFPGKVNDIVVECGNSFYQPILDRYIAGEDVPLSEARQVWRNTTQPMCGVTAFFEELFPLVRQINQKLPPEKKLRMLAGDAPIDWSTVKSENLSQFMMGRDASTASVMEKEVFARHRTALMLFGEGHLFHGKSAVGIYETDYPGKTWVIATHRGFGNGTPFSKYNDELEARIAAWPVPSLAPLKGTWLGDLDTSYFALQPFFFRRGSNGMTVIGPSTPGATENAKNNFSEKVDAYLYLGPRDLLLSEPKPAEVFLDKDYMAELQRRAAIQGGGPITDQINPEKVLARDSNPFLYDPNQMANQQFRMNASPSGGPAPGGGPQMFGLVTPLQNAPAGAGATLSKPQAIQLPPDVIRSYTGKYNPILPPGMQPPPGMPPIEVTADQEGLWITFADKHRFLPTNPDEFVDREHPEQHLTFTRDGNGQITGFAITGLGGPTGSMRAIKLP